MEEIAEVLLHSDLILLFPHDHIDGDAAGSCAALCQALRNQGKQAYILMEDAIPDNLLFLIQGYVTEDQTIFESPGICMAVDCGDLQRFEKRKDVFLTGKIKICIDHHRSEQSYADYNFVDPERAACGELIFELIKAMKAKITPSMADALYAAIATDTGNFCFSNATKETHQIIADLYDYGLNHSVVCNEVYDRVSIERIKLHAAALNEMKIFAGGRASLACVTQNLLKKTGAQMWETENLIDTMRSICGIEITALLKEAEPGTVKFSLRAKSNGNVLEIAKEFNGGGHNKAAGGTIKADMPEAVEKMQKAIETYLNGANL